MTREQYNKSIETQELQLSLWGKFAYFLIALFLFSMPILVLLFHLIDYLIGKPFNVAYPEICVIIIPTFVGYFAYRLQKKRLKFTIVKTILIRHEIEKLIMQLGEEMKWSLSFQDADIFIAKSSRNLPSGTFGEQITILFDFDKVLVNSICDPDRRTGIDITGRNSQNIDAIMSGIKKKDPTAVLINSH